MISMMDAQNGAASMEGIMRKLFSAAFAALLMISSAAGAAVAQEVIGSYSAWIGVDDLYNSNGQRLGEPWQVLRQDRANYHRFLIRQQGDEWDPFFADANNRASLEQLVRRGRIERTAGAAILRGNVMVHVTVWGTRNRIDWIDVFVDN